MINIEEMKIGSLNVVDASGEIHEIDEGWHSISGLEILSAQNQNEDSVPFDSVDIGELEMKVVDLLEDENVFDQIEYFLK